MIMSETRNWSELCPDLLGIISQKIERVDDLIRFSSICRSWRSVIVENKHTYPLFTSPSPWLMLSETVSWDSIATHLPHNYPLFTNPSNNKSRGFFSISDNTIYKVDLPQALGRHCWGSPFGWLVTLGSDRQLHLLNPLLGSRLPLPPPETFEDPDYEDVFSDHPERIITNYIRKAVIIPPTPDSPVENFIVFVTYGSHSRLAYARLGDKSWTCVSKGEEYEDVLYLNGQFYSIDQDGMVWIHDFSNSNENTTLFAKPPPDLDTPLPFYLLELDGQLHMALRLIDADEAPNPLELFHSYITDAVAVFKWDSQTSNWELLETLGGYSIFIGSSTSFALLASQHPNCKPNCIYFTDDYPFCGEPLYGRDIGIYNYEAEELEPFCVEDGNMLSCFSAPVWFTPRFL